MEKSSGSANYLSGFFESIQRGLPKRPWDWQASIITVLLVQLASTRLVMSEWVPSLRLVLMVSFYAVSIGLMIGYSSLSRRNAIWVGFEYGLLLIPMQLLKAVEPTDFLYLDLSGIMFRLQISLVFLIQNQPVYDTLFFLTLASIGFWVIGLHAGYQLARHGNYLKIIIPSGLAMLIIQIYDPWVSLRAWALAFYFFFTLALLGRINFLDNKDGWKTKRVSRTSDSEWDLSRSELTFAAIAIFAVWILPSAQINIKPITKAWNNFTEPIKSRLSNTVSALDSPYGASGGGDFYNSNLSLGNNAPVSDTVAFYVKVNQNKFEPVRYYWRGMVYDQYINGQWSSTNSTNKNFDPKSDGLPTTTPLRRHEANFTVTINFPGQKLIYAPAETIWIDHKSKLMTSSTSDSIHDVTAWLASPGLVAGDSYEVRAMIANPSINELRSAGSAYPDWVTNQYLQVPDELVQIFTRLAERVAGAYLTPYDKAQAVTAYLRKEIIYTTQLTGSPPSFEDPLVWVLFEEKKGFCMYYASAEVLLLRTLGIPARMAVGFVEGSYEELDREYIVTFKDSHAWPEVYFPNIGWVEFEPTGNQSPLNRPEEEIKEPSAGADPNDPTNNNSDVINNEELLNPGGFDPTLLAEEDLQNPTRINLQTRLLYSAIIFALFTLGIFMIQRNSWADRFPIYLEGRYTKNGHPPPSWLKHWTQWAMLTSIERSFHSIDLSLRWLHHPLPAHTTSMERAGTLCKLIPSAEAAITTLIHEQETILFTNRPGNIAAARKAALALLLKTWQYRATETLQILNTRYNRLR